MDGLVKMQTYEIVPRDSVNAILVKSGMVRKIKTDGTYKSRFVGKG